MQGVTAGCGGNGLSIYGISTCARVMYVKINTGADMSLHANWVVTEQKPEARSVVLAVWERRS